MTIEKLQLLSNWKPILYKRKGNIINKFFYIFVWINRSASSEYKRIKRMKHQIFQLLKLPAYFQFFKTFKWVHSIVYERIFSVIECVPLSRSVILCYEFVKNGKELLLFIIMASFRRESKYWKSGICDIDFWQKTELMEICGADESSKISS